ncbi:putative secretory pathway protein Ssp120 [Venturia nashicola]|uniref:Putative secretory pathway protein Ssp120 n=1 Tax=Venturia nashicola TaxID=86259 RepID=A0A4Z1PDQ0_9PEZI|nr:putative secretory pathway protein Ssp120 [Venturia nashicola]
MFRIIHVFLLSTSILELPTRIFGANAHADHAQGHGQQPLAAGADWQTRHMSDEHHMQGFDAASFFKLHDFDNTGAWSPEDIRKMLGLYDESTQHVSEADKVSAVDKVLSLYDADRSGTISFAEFTVASAKGITLPDLGYGPGHHGDMEEEYELHHFEKYHSGDDVKEEDLNHPEDIEHFRKHDEEERIQEEWEKIAISGDVIEHNIPEKFLRI